MPATDKAQRVIGCLLREILPGSADCVCLVSKLCRFRSEVVAIQSRGTQVSPGDPGQSRGTQVSPDEGRLGSGGSVRGKEQ